MSDNKEVFMVIETFINWNRNDAVKDMKNLKEEWLELELLEQLSVYKKEFQIEILSYFYKNS